MGPSSSWRKNVVLAAIVLALLGVAGLSWWRSQQTSPQREVTTKPSPPGWEVRYNATVALAQRGSDKVADRLDILAEMLDEERQRANFSKKEGDRPLVDEAGASGTVLNVLHAVTALHRKNPAVDLSELHEPIGKLKQSPNAVVRLQAEQTLNELTPK